LTLNWKSYSGLVTMSAVEPLEAELEEEPPAADPEMAAKPEPDPEVAAEPEEDPPAVKPVTEPEDDPELLEKRLAELELLEEPELLEKPVEENPELDPEKPAPPAPPAKPAPPAPAAKPAPPVLPELKLVTVVESPRRALATASAIEGWRAVTTSLTMTSWLRF